VGASEGRLILILDKKEVHPDSGNPGSLHHLSSLLHTRKELPRRFRGNCQPEKRKGRLPESRPFSGVAMIPVVYFRESTVWDTLGSLAITGAIQWSRICHTLKFGRIY
jgi:hypothetical protein